MTLTKAKLAARVQQGVYGAKPWEAARLVNRLLGIIQETLAQGEDVLLTGFGKFVVREAAPPVGDLQARHHPAGQAQPAAARPKEDAGGTEGRQTAQLLLVTGIIVYPKLRFDLPKKMSQSQRVSIAARLPENFLMMAAAGLTAKNLSKNTL